MESTLFWTASLRQGACMPVRRHRLPAGDGAPNVGWPPDGDNKKPGKHFVSRVSCDGRGDRIRTCDLYVPNVALYQTELHPASRALYAVAAWAAIGRGAFLTMRGL